MKKMRIVVFGGGMQGRVIAGDLALRPEKPDIVIADIAAVNPIASGVHWQQCNVLDGSQVAMVLQGADAAVLAVPSGIAHDALSNILAAGVPVADVSFTPQPPLSLNNLAALNGSCCIVDCGVAPGLSHILVGRAHEQLGGLDDVQIFVGGMPQNPPEVFRHAVYFNAADLLSEYTRPARARVQQKNIAPAPLDTPLEKYTDSELGTLDAFLSDGLRSLLESFPHVANMQERTLRWPGHWQTMLELQSLGQLDEPAIETTAATFAAKYRTSDYPDVFLMVVEASKEGAKLAWRLLDRYSNGQSAMSRTTGYTTAAVAMVLARKQFTQPGVHPPEVLGKDAGLTQTIINDLCRRGVILHELCLPGQNLENTRDYMSAATH